MTRALSILVFSLLLSSSSAKAFIVLAKDAGDVNIDHKLSQVVIVAHQGYVEMLLRLEVSSNRPNGGFAVVLALPTPIRDVERVSLSLNGLDAFTTQQRPTPHTTNRAVQQALTHAAERNPPFRWSPTLGGRTEIFTGEEPGQAQVEALSTWLDEHGLASPDAAAIRPYIAAGHRLLAIAHKPSVEGSQQGGGTLPLIRFESAAVPPPTTDYGVPAGTPLQVIAIGPDVGYVLGAGNSAGLKSLRLSGEADGDDVFLATAHAGRLSVPSGVEKLMSDLGMEEVTPYDMKVLFRAFNRRVSNNELPAAVEAAFPTEAPATAEPAPVVPTEASDLPQTNPEPEDKSFFGLCSVAAGESAPRLPFAFLVVAALLGFVRSRKRD